MDLIEVREVRIARERADLRFGPGTRALGGGSWLYSEAQPGVDELIDLTGLGWTPVESRVDGIRVAATCTIAEALRVADAAAWGPGVAALFRKAADSLVASWKIWGSATVGGNVCLALPAGAFTSILVALDGEAVIWQALESDVEPGERRLPVVDVVTGVRQTALRHGEVLRAIDIPASALAARAGFRRAALAPLGRSGAVVVARRDTSGAFVLSLSAATPRPHRLRFPEPPTAIELASALDRAVATGDGWYDDAHGAPDWRRARSLALAEELRRELSVATTT